MTISIRFAHLADAPAIAAIYNRHIATGVATFEEQPVPVADMEQRLQHCSGPWLVAHSSEALLGFAYADTFKARTAYRHTIEVTIYLAEDYVGQGLGSMLYSELFARLRAAQYHCAVAAIALPNESSVSLHEKFGMRRVGTLREIGHKFDRWIDVGYWQVML